MPLDVERSKWVSVAAALFLCWSTSTVAVRVWIRLCRLGPWARDDTTIAIAHLLAAIQSALAILAAKSHYGDNTHDTLFALKTTYVSQILYIASLCACKCSGAMLIGRLSPKGRHRVACHTISAASIVWALLSIIAVALRGNLAHPWETIDGAPALFHRWLGVEIVGMLIELVLFYVSVSLIRRLQMARSIKTVILLAFSGRLFIVPIISVRLYYLDPNYYVENSEHIVLAAVMTQIVMHYSLMSASIPCLKPFMRPFDVVYATYSYTNDDLDDQNLSRTRSRGNGNGYLYYNYSDTPAKDKFVSVTTSGVRSPNRKEQSKSRSFCQILLGKKKSRENLRSLTAINGDSNFRSDREIGTFARAGSTTEDIASDPRPDLAPLDKDDLIIRQTKGWSVKRELRNATTL